MLLVVVHEFVLGEKASSRTPGSLVGVLVPGFVQVGFAAATAVRMFIIIILLLIEKSKKLFGHFAGGPSFQNATILLGIDKGDKVTIVS